MFCLQTSNKIPQKLEIIREFIIHHICIRGYSLSIASGGISLIAISTVALLIQIWMKHKDLDLKIQNCTYAYQSYQHLLNEIKDVMRSGEFNPHHIYNTMKNIDDYVTDNSPVVDKYLVEYDKKFTC